jgi:hypothetical protein
LPGISESVFCDGAGRHFEVGVGANDRRALAAELQGDALHGAGGSRRDRLAGRGAPGKRDLARQRVLDHRHADGTAPAGHDVEAAGRKPGLAKQSGEHQRRQRGVVGRLGDHGATGDQRRAELENQKRDRIVERRDRDHDADRLACDDDFLTGDPGQRHLGVEAQALLRIDLQQVRRALDFGDRAGERTAKFGGEHSADVTGPLPHQLRGTLLQPGALGDRRRLPALEGAVRGPDREVGVCRAAHRHGVDHDTGRRIDDVLACARSRRHPFAVDKHVHSAGSEKFRSGEA